MKGIDTNLLVRLVVNDDKRQSKLVLALLDQEEKFFVPITVTLELEWVLRGAYKIERTVIFAIYQSLLSIRNLTFEREEAVNLALDGYRDGLDFADALHHACCTHCELIFSFDKNFHQLANRRSINPQVLLPS